MPAAAKNDTLAAARPEPGVLIVGNSVEGGGAERRLSLMAEYLFSGRSQLAVLRAPEGSKRLLHDLGWSGPFSYPRVIRRLRRLLRSGAYDAVVAFDRYPVVCLAIAAMGLARRPAIVAMEVSRPRSVARDGAGNWRALALPRLEHWAYRQADVVAANSADGAEECVKHYRVPRGKVVRVNNLLPISEFGVQSAAAGDRGADGLFRVCVVSRLVPFKRIDTVLEALARFSDDVPWQLTVAGAGPQRHALEEQARDAGIADRVTFCGWVQDPRAVVRSADVLVQASRYEGFANAVIEAMAAGVPVITSTSTSDAREMVRQGAALGFEPGDVQGLCGALARIRTEPSLRRELTANAVRYIQPFDARIAIAQYEAAIRKALRRT